MINNLFKKYNLRGSENNIYCLATFILLLLTQSPTIAIFSNTIMGKLLFIILIIFSSTQDACLGLMITIIFICYLHNEKLQEGFVALQIGDAPPPKRSKLRFLPFFKEEKPKIVYNGGKMKELEKKKKWKLTMPFFKKEKKSIIEDEPALDTLKDISEASPSPSPPNKNKNKVIINKNGENMNPDDSAGYTVINIHTTS
jgi:hypothetical protein